MRKFRQFTVICGAVSVLILGLFVTPALASDRNQQTCAIQEFLPFASCNSSAVQADSATHKIWFRYGSSDCPLQYRIRDVGNGVLVGSGTALNGNSSIGGLFGSYRIEISRTGGISCGGDALIRNFA